MTDPITDAARALLDALRFDRPSLMEAPLHTPQRARFKALYAAAPFIRGEVAALTDALGTQTTDEVVPFDEQALRAAIVSIWGGHGAHVDVLDELIRRAPRPEDTTDEVLWEGETGYFAMDDLTDSHVDQLTLDVPPGTRVRVVRATDQPSEDQP